MKEPFDGPTGGAEEHRVGAGAERGEQPGMEAAQASRRARENPLGLPARLSAGAWLTKRVVYQKRR